MQIGDCFTYHRRSRFPDLAEASSEAVRDSFVLVPENGEICGSIIKRIASYPHPQPNALLFMGNKGAGKSHLLRYLECLLATPEDPAWAGLEPYLRGAARPTTALSCRFIQVPADPGVDLGGFLISQLQEQNAAAEHATEPGADQFASRVGQAAAVYGRKRVGLVAIEDISYRIDRSTDMEKVRREIGLYKIVSEVLGAAGILVILVAEDKHLRKERGASAADTPLEALSKSAECIWITRNNVAEIINTAIARKEDAHKKQVRGIVDSVRRKLPLLGTKAEVFTYLYPIHPMVFEALFQLRPALPRFSPVGFLQAAIDAARSRLAEKLVTIADLFDYVLPDLSKQEKFQTLIAAFDEFHKQIIPLLKPSVQPKAESLLKGIAFLTVCNVQSPSIKTLANALLLYDDSDLLPSYSLAAALLMEMEIKGGAYLVAEGEKLDRSYHLLGLREQANLYAAREMVEKDEQFRLRFPLLLYDWFRSEIPPWQPDVGPKYQRSSQSLIVPIPEGEVRPVGMVHFKSIFDPPWSKEDLATLQDGAYPWVLLILSPFERYYELEAPLREIAAHSSKVMIWRPDSPTAKETERLHRLAAEYTAEPEDSSPDASGFNDARGEIKNILTSLYVQRGQFVTSGDQWSIGDEIENRTLPHYVSIHLLSLASAAGTAAESAITAPQPEGETEALHWGAVLCGSDELSTLDIDSARSRLLAWWAGPLDLQSKTLSGTARPLSEAFMTTRFWNLVKPFAASIDLLKPILNRLRRRQISFVEAMVQIKRHFHDDEKRLLAWRHTYENLAALREWLPDFEHARSYLRGAVPTGVDKLDQQRSSLLDVVDQPQRFLKKGERESWDRSFSKFKKAYVDFYYARHEDALHIVGNPEKAKSMLDSVALRNLELLSDLHYTDKSYLNRVRVLTAWLERNQCSLPVRAILDRIPRCYCNFDPSTHKHLAESASQINRMIQDGIEYFRAVLRKCRTHIIDEVKSLKLDENHSKQIAALLSRGQMIQLKPRSIEVLNNIIQKHSTDFLTEIRSHKKTSSSSI